MDFAVNIIEMEKCIERIKMIADSSLPSTASTIERLNGGTDEIALNLATAFGAIKDSIEKRRYNIFDFCESSENAIKKYKEVEERIKNQHKPSERAGDGEQSHESSHSRGNEDDRERDELDIERIEHDWEDILRNLRGVDVFNIASVVSAIGDFIDSLDLDIYDLYEIYSRIDWNNLNLEEVIDVLTELGYTDQLMEYIANYNVPDNLDDGNLLALSLIASYIERPSGTEARAHRRHNEALWEQNITNLVSSSGYIENQSLFSDFQFGDNTMDYNGCGVIATYNALYSLTNGEMDIPFADIAREYERFGIMGGGIAGTSPAGMQMFFESQGYDAELIYGNDIDNYTNSGNCETFILTAYNDATDVTAAVHNICITYDSVNNQYVMHNAGGTVTGDTLQEVIDNYGGEAITLIAID